MTEETREAWLGRAVSALADGPLAEYKVPPVRISVGYGGTQSKGGTIVGTCHPRAAAADKVNQIFVGPMHDANDPVELLDTVVHEMIHAIDDCKSGHRGNFAVIGKAVGFVSPSGACKRSDELAATLAEIGERLGPFPHAALAVGGRSADAPATQKGRQLKVECPACGCIARMSRGAIDTHGLPTCACGTEFQEA